MICQATVRAKGVMLRRLSQLNLPRRMCRINPLRDTLSDCLARIKSYTAAVTASAFVGSQSDRLMASRTHGFGTQRDFMAL